MKVENILLIVAVTLVLFIPVWSFIIVPELKAIPANYYTHIEFLGMTNWTDPGKEMMTIIQHEIHTEKAISIKDNRLKIGLETVATNLISKEIFWQSYDNLSIDRKTKKYIDNEVYFFFPYHLEEKNIENMKFYSYLPVTTFYFEREETVNGLNTYVFSYKIPAIESSDFYPLWAAENEDILMDDWGLAWIEPVSGHVVKAEDNWDAYLKSNPGKHIDVGKIWYTDDTIYNQVRIAQDKKRTLLLYEILFPSLIGLIALAFIITVLLNMPKHRKSRRRE